ncbi:MAG TPA: Ppx/GppA phosphatase family protein [Bacteroidota bacterium]
MRVGAIDIGTNTILLLVADIQPDGTLVVVRDEHAIARLGKGVDAHQMILSETFERAVEFLQPYQSVMTAERVEVMTVCGTSFLRDAQNKNEFIEFVQQKLGLQIRVLSGDEEGDLTYLGGISEFRTPGKKSDFAVLDIGGGSTELTVGTDSTVSHRVSFDIGSVRLTERFLKTSPPATGGLESAREYIRTHLQRHPHVPSSARLIGVAGTLTTLAAMELNLKHYDRTAVSGHVLTRATVNNIFEELSSKNLDELKAYPQILPARADILLAGILILREILDTLEREEVTVSDRGLRFGMAIEAAKQNH